MCMCVYTHRVTNSNVSKPSDVPKPLKKFTDTTLLATNRVLELQPTLPSTLLQRKVKGWCCPLKPPHTPRPSHFPRHSLPLVSPLLTLASRVFLALLDKGDLAQLTFGFCSVVSDNCPHQPPPTKNPQHLGRNSTLSPIP